MLQAFSVAAAAGVLVAYIAPKSNLYLVWGEPQQTVINRIAELDRPFDVFNLPPVFPRRVVGRTNNCVLFESEKLALPVF